MSHGRYIAIILLAGLFSWMGWILIINKLSPDDNVGIVLALFFLTFFIALGATFAVLGYYFRLWLFRNEIFYKHINVSLRQGVLLALVSVFSLVFQMLKVLNWWSGMLILVITVLLEMYFSTRDSEFS